MRRAGKMAAEEDARRASGVPKQGRDGSPSGPICFRFWLLALIVAGGWAAPFASRAQAMPIEVEEEEEEVVQPLVKKTYSPTVQASIDAFLKKLTDAKRKLLVEQMQKEIETVAKTTGLNAAAVKALDPAAQQAAEKSAQSWSAKFSEMMLLSNNLAEEQMAAELEMAALQIEAIVKQESPIGGADTNPTEHPVWTEALRRALSPEQLAAWDKVKAGRSDALEKEIGVFLDAQMDRVREQYRQAILAKSNGIALALGLSKERAEQLDAIAKSAADESVKDTRVTTKKALQAMPAERRRQLSRGNFFMASEQKSQPENQAIWKDGLAKFLSADEQQRLLSAKEDRKLRRARVLAQVMLSLLDEKIAFTARQREQIQPIAERLVKGEKFFFPTDGSESGNRFSPPVFYSAAAKATEEEIKAILDPLQCKRWQVLGVADETDAATGAARRAALSANASKPPPLAEPEDVERILSDFLYEKSERQKKRLIAAMTLRAEDAARIAVLPAEVNSRLQSAARGAAEASLMEWKGNTASNVRSQLQDAAPQTVRLRLASIQDYYFRDNGSPPDQQSLWTKTVKTALNDVQQAAWKKETDARGAYRDRSIAAFILAEFDRQNPLTQEQWDKLGSVISAVIKDYSPDISRMFSMPGNESPWYMQSYTMFMPFAGVPAETLEAILGKEPCKRWMESTEYTNSASYWENVQNYHKSRTRENKE